MEIYSLGTTKFEADGVRCACAVTRQGRVISQLKVPSGHDFQTRQVGEMDEASGYVRIADRFLDRATFIDICGKVAVPWTVEADLWPVERFGGYHVHRLRSPGVLGDLEWYDDARIAQNAGLNPPTVSFAKSPSVDLDTYNRLFAEEATTQIVRTTFPMRFKAGKYKANYPFREGERAWSLKYSGTADPVERLAAGTLLALFVARAWHPGRTDPYTGRTGDYTFVKVGSVLDR